MTAKELKKDFKKIDRYSKGLTLIFNRLRWILNILLGSKTSIVVYDSLTKKVERMDIGV